MLTHISTEYYVRLEQARAPQPSADVLAGSAAFDVLAWNDLAVALMEDFDAKPAHDRNLARRAFLPDVSEDAPLYGISDATNSASRR